MAAPVTYPTLPGIDIKVIWRPKALNFPPQIHASGREVIVAASQYPLHEFELIYNMLRNTPTQIEFKTYMGFFLQMAGVLNGFLFQNPYDYSVLANPINPYLGSATQYLLTRNYGAGGFLGTEPVGYVNVGATFNAYGNGTLIAPSGYSLDQTSPGRILINFTSAPATPVTVDMSYYYFCRFSDDALDFEQLLWNIFVIKKVVLLSKRGPGPVGGMLGQLNFANVNQSALIATVFP